MTVKAKAILLLQLFIAIGYVAGDCDSPLGMENRQIPDSHIKASSEVNRYHAATNARYGHVAGGGQTGSWSSGYLDIGQWLQVDLGAITKVTKIGTQGRQEAYQWVTEYKVSYSFDGNYYQFMKLQPPSNVDQVYPGNSDRNSIAINVLDPPIIARFIRIHPVKYYGWMSMRMELFGCHSGFPTPSPPACKAGLGMESYAIPDSAVTASSFVNAVHKPGNGRLHLHPAAGRIGSWAAGHLRDGSWFQVNFGSWTKVTVISTQGRQDAAQWVKSYTVSYGYDGIFFQDYMEDGDYVKLFDGNTDRYTVVTHELKFPIIARYIRINPVSYYGWISMRADFYGCKSGFPIPEVSSCRTPLGMESGQIPNSAISASTQLSPAYAPENARLHFKTGGGRIGAWIPVAQNLNQWLQVDFQTETQVTGISSQGRQEADQWVKSYTLRFSSDGFNFIHYQPKSHTKTFTANSDRMNLVSHILDPPIIARYVRIVPESWYSYIAMRVEFYGCKSKDGGYSAWSAWSSCSVTCGDGEHSRSRTCTSPPPSAGGKDCSQLGPDTETGECKNAGCPVDGGYSEWKSWTPCSVTCGGGKRSRGRVCDSPIPQGGGDDCSNLGPATESEICNIDPCPVDGNWGNWGAWKNCPVTCGGGIQSKTRKCNNPWPSGGGRSCPGASEQTRECNTAACKNPVDGNWGNWGTWGSCSVTCGGGTRRKTRQCNNPAPADGGSNCPGTSEKTQGCNTQSCQETWKPIGCYQNRGRALGDVLMKNKGYKNVAEKLKACVTEADNRGVTLFGLDDTKCWTSTNAAGSYDKYGLSGQCRTRKGTSIGLTAAESMYVYQRDNKGDWQKVECYSNKSPPRQNALPDSFDDSVGSVKGPDAIFKHCKEKAEGLGYKVFGADDKNCWTGGNAANTYNKFGKSTTCVFSKKTGNGSGKKANGDVYVYELK